VANPFGVNAGKISGQLTQTIENAKRDGVEVIEQEAGSQSAGLIRRAGRGRVQEYVVRLKPEKEIVRLPVRYEVLLNSRHSPEEKYATLVHELGHLYCGHLGTPNDKWWPDRRGLGKVACEFEAESVCYLVCTRLGIGNPSAEYLAGYVSKHAETPALSLDCVMKAAGL